MSDLEKLLNEKINITSEMEEKSKIIYETLASFLSKELEEFDPDIFSQGSFKLGTVIKPIKGDDFDLDFVCCLNLDKNRISSSELYKKLGLALNKNFPLDDKSLEPKNRCWRINFKNFHIDIIPAVPNFDMNGYETVFDEVLKEKTMLIPDKELSTWTHTNPLGYAEWFNQRKNQVEVPVKVENMTQQLPKQNIDTILQKAVKIMKYHRDLMFGDDKNKPISIIVTTLAARHYQGEQNLELALNNIAQGIMSNYADIFESNRLCNPVLQSENFADKWSDHPERKDACKKWVNSLYNFTSDYYLNYNNSEFRKKLLIEHFSYNSTDETAPYRATGTIKTPHKQWNKNG